MENAVVPNLSLESLKFPPDHVESHGTPCRGQRVHDKAGRVCKRRSREVSEDDLAFSGLVGFKRRSDGGRRWGPRSNTHKVAKILKRINAEIVGADRHGFFARFLERCDTTAWQQANPELLAALLEDDLEEVGAFWQQAVPENRAWACLWALLLNRDSIAAWMTSRPDFSEDDVASLIGECFSGLFLFLDFVLLVTHIKQWPSEALLRAALQSGCRVSTLSSKFLSERLMAAGGLDLVLFAHEHGSCIIFPIEWEKPFLIRQAGECTFSTGLASGGVFTGDLLLSRAVYTKDLALLEQSIAMARDHGSSSRYKGALRVAVRMGWLRGAQLICELCFECRVPARFFLTRAALEDPSLSCLNWLRNNGLGGDLCVHVLGEERFDVLEQLFQEGCPEPAVASVSALGSDNHASLNWWMHGTQLEDHWQHKIRGVIEERFRFHVCLRKWQETPSAQHTAYVASLINAAVAQKLVPQIQQWRASAGAGALALMKWWAQQSEAYAKRHGCAPLCHLPHVLEAILEQSGLMTPSVQRRAEAIAAKIRTWLGLPSGAHLDVH
eukprot:jgi/Botrbrau1/6524/Bobra.0034s0096.1